MRIVCLMPTYGRRKELLENSLACFVSQTHAEKKLVIYDDLGTLAQTRCDREDVVIVSRNSRCSSVGAKYNDLFAAMPPEDYDAIAVWDDDDIYLPDYLVTHAEVLKTAKWSKPSQIISAYFDPPRIESAAGRFHGSIAVRRDMLQDLANRFGTPWIDTTRATFDQEFLTRCTQYSPPGNPCQIAPPQYVYRWQGTKSGHCSGLMDRATWYRDYQPDSRALISVMEPRPDNDKRAISLLVQTLL